MDWLHLLKPYQFSALATALTLVFLGLYLRGLRVLRAAGEPVGVGRRLAFLCGLALCYLVLQTRFDYYAQYLFFAHRLQHLVLHHAGPFLIALAAPWAVLARGLPAGLRQRWLRPLWRHPILRGGYRRVQHPVVAPVLFVGLIYVWLIPEVHFDAMLNLSLYHLMNASMLIDGLLFWWLMLNPGVVGTAAPLRYGARILILCVIAVPQIALGAYIALSRQELFEVYAVCGRAWPLAPTTDQLLGGLLTWIPAAMMSVLGILVVLRLMLRHERAKAVSVPADPAVGPSGSGSY